MQDEKYDQISNNQVEDNGAKLIFKNPTLCAQLLREYSNIDILKNVQAEDITDITERYIPMFTTERDADVVKQVRISDNEDVIVTLIEHKSHVDYNVAMQVLRYMTYIWEDYEKNQENRVQGISQLKGFKYPPIFPIVYYNGSAKWTVDSSFMSKIYHSDVFAPYIPNFRYHLVNTADYGNDELIKKNDGLSFIMMINKIKEASAFADLKLPKEYLDNLSANSPADVLDVLARVIAVVLRKQSVPENEIQDFVTQIKERKMSDLFEGWKGFNVQEERKSGGDVKLIGIVCNMLSKGKEISEISDMTGENQDIVRAIVDVAKGFAPDYNAEKIYSELKKTEKITAN